MLSLTMAVAGSRGFLHSCLLPHVWKTMHRSQKSDWKNRLEKRSVWKNLRATILFSYNAPDGASARSIVGSIMAATTKNVSDISDCQFSMHKMRGDGSGVCACACMLFRRVFSFKQICMYTAEHHNLFLLKTNPAAPDMWERFNLY